MTTNHQLPQELESIIGPEHKEFAVKAKYAYTRKSALSTIFFGFMVLIFIGIFSLISFYDYLENQNLNPSEISSYLQGFIGSNVILIFFVLGGLIFFISGIRSLFTSGGYFVGTKDRLITYRKGKTRIIDWEQFNGNIEMSASKNTGNITLFMRSGKMVRKNNNNQYVADTINIVGVPEVIEVERICRKRIKENDPTPTT